MFTTPGTRGNSISVALGLAAARDARGTDETVVAVIGDGSLTGGMAFEALNHAGHLGTRVIIVLNDNEMSIAPNGWRTWRATSPACASTGATGACVTTSSPRSARRSFGAAMVAAGEAAKESVKQLLVPGMLFEELGIKYVGPIDGHDVQQVQNAVSWAKRNDGPVLIHAVTRKGMGYTHAEDRPDTFHGISPFSVETGKVETPRGPLSYTETFGRALMAEAESDERIVAITAAMPAGTGLSHFAERFPERFFDVGIAEQHAVGLAAGLAHGGLLPVVAIYSTFLQRAYDQVIMDAALQNLHIVFCLDRAGLVGEDGPTHHGVFDLTYLAQFRTSWCLRPPTRPSS